MKKTVFTLLLTACCLTIMQAKPVDVNTAKALGVKFMNANTSVKSSQADLCYVASTEQGETCFYVFSVYPKGFVIVSADDRAKPILGYSTESNFTPNLPDGLMTFFDNYKAGFSQMYANNDERTAEAVADWNSLAATGRLSDKKINRSVEPLLASIWNQTDLYNDQAPADPNSLYNGHCKSGCVANTMSQLMRYWEWPRTGVGSHSYYAYSYYGNYGMQEADFGNATYRFELMPDFLDYASPQYEVDATALLEYHAGVSVEMGYGPSASGAYSGDVPPAMESYFRYDPSMQLRELGDQTVWENDLRDNLDQGMPFYYSSQGPDGGHAYVLDGYDDNNMFHLNWGWAGFDNGYYAIDGFYLTFYSFPWMHAAIFNMHPVAEYYDAPMAVDHLEATATGSNMVSVHFNPVYMTRNEEAMSVIDNIVIMRDGDIVAELPQVSDAEVTFEDQVDKKGTYYYTVYAVNEAGMSKVARDTVMVGATCDVRFELHDTGNNGWDMSFIAILDEDGKLQQRVGLWEGGEATIIAPAPSGQMATFFWTYDNTCYSHGSLEEVSYEIYDWDDNMIYASIGYPDVGDIIDYMIDCSLIPVPVTNLEGVCQWNEDGEYGVLLTWDWNGNSSDFKSYNIYRDGTLIATIEDVNVTNYYDVINEKETLNYTVTVTCERDGETVESPAAQVSVVVTSVTENAASVGMYPNPASTQFYINGSVVSVKVFNAVGQLMHEGDSNTVDVRDWNEGVYFVSVTDENGQVSVAKLIKKK